MTQQLLRSDVVPAMLIQWTLVLAAGWVARAVVSRASAVTRSAVGRATLLCVVGAPVVSILAVEFRIPQMVVMLGQDKPANQVPAGTWSSIGETARSGSGVGNASLSPAKPRELVNGNEVSAAVRTGPSPERDGPISRGTTVPRSNRLNVMGVLVAVWAVVSAGLLVRLAIANLVLEVRRRGAAEAPRSIAEHARALGGHLGVRPPPVRISRAVGVSCVTGVLRPMILLPLESSDDVEPEVMLHELAHLARGDCAWALLAAAVVAVLWWHPLAWVLARNVERDSEEACDDVVLLHGGERSRYARTLVETAGRLGRAPLLPGLAPAILSRGSAVGRRVRRVLDTRHSPSDRVARMVGYALTIYVLAMGTVCAVVRAGGEGAGQKSADPGTPASASSAAKHYGRVIDAVGNPVAWAELYLLKYGLSPSLEVVGKITSDRDGRFEFSAELPPDPSNNRYDVQTVVPGNGVGEARPEPGKECVIQLIAPTRITLTVLGPDGKPLTGLKVFPASFASMPAHGAILLGVPSVPVNRSFFMKLPPELYAPMGGVTDARGSVTLENLPRGQGFELGFDDPRFARPGIINRIGLAENSPVTPPQTIQLEQAATISGTVRYGPTGKGTAGPQVSAQPTRNNYPPRSLSGGIATTDATGAYQITGLAAGEYNVTVYLDPDLQKHWVGTAREAVKLEAGQTLKDVDVTLVKGGIVRGRVVTADTAQPIRATITVQSGEVFAGSAGSTETGADGSYSVRVRPGPQRVFLYVVGPDVYRQAAQQPREVQVDEGQTASVDFRVPRREGQTVEGVVIGVDGKPAAGVVVKAEWGAVFSNPIAVTTDAAGRFRIERVPLDGQIFVDSNDVGTTESTSITRDTAPLRLQLVRKFVQTMKGLVTDDAGKPVPNARIELSQVLGSSTLSGLGGPLISDSTGRYEIKDLHGGYEYELLATADGHGEARERFTPNADSKTLPTLKTPRADLKTGGIVVDEAGVPVAGATAYLNDGRDTRATSTDGQGEFSFTVVRGKRYVLWSVLQGEEMKSDEVDGGEGKTQLKLVLKKQE